MKTNDRKNENNEKYYKLSKYGLYILIINNKNLPYSFVKSILTNYPDHIIFRLFVFPYIKRTTLLRITGSYTFERIFFYLHECCIRVQDTIHAINHTYNQKNGYLTDQLFVWENVPEVEDDRENLRNFLKQKFNWNWLDNAYFKKTDDLNGIVVSYGLKSILISLDNKTGKATLSFKGKKEYEFAVRDLTDGFAVDATTTPLEEFCVKIFLISYITLIPNFIISLIPLQRTYSLNPDMEILGQDERFTQVLKKIKYHFGRTCDLIFEQTKSLS